jgi:hypothetical protein
VNKREKSLNPSPSLPISASQAIDILEDMLDNGFEGRQNMFAAREYVTIYT